MSNFHFELVSPEKLLFSGAVASVVVPGSEGEMTILAQHAPLVTMLRPGVVRVEGADGKSARLFVRGGFADVSAPGLTILAEQATSLDDLDYTALEADIREARKIVATSPNETARAHASEDLARLEELHSFAAA
jgi:F-type H+-transporting ATPase subunit epsilon